MDVSNAGAWAIITGTFAFALFLLVSPAERFAETAMQHSQRVTASASGALTIVPREDHAALLPATSDTN